MRLRSASAFDQTDGGITLQRVAVPGGGIDCNQKLRRATTKYGDPSPFDYAQGQDDNVKQATANILKQATTKQATTKTSNDEIQGSFTPFRMTTS
jgi:hypothetical protein